MPHCPGFASFPSTSCHDVAPGCVLIVYVPGASVTVPNLSSLSVTILVAVSDPVRHTCPAGIICASARPLSDGRPYEIAMCAPSTTYSDFQLGLPPVPGPVCADFCATAACAS